MTFAEILINFAISYFAGSLPSIKGLLKDKSLNGRMNERFDAAMKQFFPNEQLRNKPPLRYSSLSAFGQYLANNEKYDEETQKFIQALEEEYRADELCYNYIIEMKLEEMADNIREIKEAVRKQQKSFNELSDNLRNVDRYLARDYHIERRETSAILDWLLSEGKNKPDQRICIVSGEAGCGKTVVLSDLLRILEGKGIPVIGLKSDYLFDNNDSNIDKALNLNGISLIEMIEDKAAGGITVILIDQVDALSLSLTFKRKPLAEVQRVISHLSLNDNVRIILSCREYDYKSERAFYRYNGCQQVLITRLDKEDVDKALKGFNISTTELTEEGYRFLQNPMNLSLYCRLGENSHEVIKATQSAVFSAYWKQVLTTNANEKGIDTKSLQIYLERLVGLMIKEQVLSIHSQRMGVGMINEQSFLLSEGYLAQSSDGGQIQFRHQTLFDYTYSRLFFESGRTVENDFVGVHQGLFVRSRLKTLLSYLRDVSPSQYIDIVRNILTSGVYRFHLKQLVITLIGSFPVLLPQEEQMLTEVILQEKKLLGVFIRTVYSIGPVKCLTNYINKNGSFSQCEWLLAERVLDLANYIFEQDYEEGLWLLNQIDFESMKGDRLSALVRSLNYLPIKNAEIAGKVLNKVLILDNDDSNIQFHHFYSNIAKFQPETVSKRIVRYVGALLGNWDKKNDWKFDVSDDLRDMNEALEKSDFHLSLLTGLEQVEMIAEATRLELDGYDICLSSLYWHYNRMNSSFHYGEVLLDQVLEQVEKEVKDGHIEIDEILERLSQKTIDVYHIIAITGWLVNTAKYKETACGYLIDNLKKQNISSLLHYYHTKLLGEVFMLLNQGQQAQLIDIVRAIEPEWEKGQRPVHKEYRDKTPNTSRGYTKCKLLGAIPNEYLHDNFKEAWKELEAIKRKGFDTTNDAPNKIESHHGWTTIEPEKLEKMSIDDRVRLAEKYDTDMDYEWSRPTRVGLAWSMRDEVKKNPEQGFEVYNKLLDNNKADLYYVSSALEALQESGLPDEKMTEIYSKLIKAIGKDINTAQPEVLIDICRSLEYYIKNDRIAPKVLIEYVMKIAREATDHDDAMDTDVDYNTGINQVRGSAVDHLVRSIDMEPYADDIFTVLYDIAENASVATRSAALFQMAVMMRSDKEKTLQLFLRLTHDYNKNLLKLPAHNMNPILYLISYNFDALKDYFEHCILEPSSHRVNIVWLLVATLRKKEGAEEMLFKMADTSVEGRTALVKETENYYNANSHALIEKALRRYLPYDEEQLGRTYDSIFDGYYLWPEEALIDYLNAFFESPVSKYCNHFVYEFLEKFSEKKPHQTLYWLLAKYYNKSGYWREFDSMTEVLLAAYNRILEFDKNDKVVEDAMDMLDAFLQSDDAGLIAQVSREIANV